RSSSTTTASVNANASQTGSSGSGPAAGVGVAVGVNNATVGNRAVIGGNADLQATTINVEALTPQASAVNAEATSGPGTENFGANGAFAFNNVDNRSEALVLAGSSADVGGADVTLSAQNNATSTARATPLTNVDAGKFGFGSSFALDSVTHISRGEIEDGA